MELTMRMQAHGPQTAAELAAAVRVTQPQISRAIASAGEAIVRFGAARRSRYALRRNVGMIGNRWPVYRIDETGKAVEYAHLEGFHQGWRVQWIGAGPKWAHLTSDPDGWWEGFPFFIGDLRPQGFLGRLIARRVAQTLLLPSDVNTWGDDHTLIYLSAEGDDLPGDIVLGDAPLRRALAGEASCVVSAADRAVAYPDLATRTIQGAVPGSSAGGEQPKFVTWIRRPADTGADIRAIMVKFSPLVSTPTGRRWADLLACEAHAIEVLAAVGEAQAGARVIDAGDRRFLEVDRFDRVNTRGRRGFISLTALYGATSLGPATNWSEAGRHLATAGMISAETLTSVRRRQFFGELIGNSDMHFGNLSFWLRDTPLFELTPSYDMLPMLWAPVAQGEVWARELTPLPPTPAQAGDWFVAAEWAETFWQRVASDSRISPDFTAIAEHSLTIVQALRARIG